MYKAGDYIYNTVNPTIYYIWGVQWDSYAVTKVKANGELESKEATIKPCSHFDYRCFVKVRLAKSAKGWCYVYYNHKEKESFFGQVRKYPIMGVSEAPDIHGCLCLGTHEFEWVEPRIFGAFSEAL